MSIHIATGLDTWASAGAMSFAALAVEVPSFIDHLTIVADRDRGGMDGDNALSAALSQLGVENVVTFPESPK